MNPHPLTDEDITVLESYSGDTVSVTVTHAPTGVTATAEGVRASLPALREQTMDTVLATLEQNGGC
jgi:hypothetical protein